MVIWHGSHDDPTGMPELSIWAKRKGGERTGKHILPTCCVPTLMGLLIRRVEVFIQIGRNAFGQDIKFRHQRILDGCRVAGSNITLQEC